MLIAGKQNSINLSKAKVVNLYAKRGDTFSFPFIAKQPLVGTYIIDAQTQYLLDVNGNIIYDSNNQPIIVGETSYQILSKLTGTVIQSSIKKDKKSKEAVKVFNVSVNIKDNSIILSLSAKDTLIPAGKYYYDVELYDIETNTNTTILEGSITFSQDITDFADLKKGDSEFTLNNFINFDYISKRIFETSLNNSITQINILKTLSNSLFTNTINYSVNSIQSIENIGLLKTKIMYNIYPIPYIRIINTLTESTKKLNNFINVNENILNTIITYKIS